MAQDHRTALARARARQEARECRQLGLSLAETAQVLGVSPRTIARWTEGFAVNADAEPPANLTTSRARTVWRLMQQERAARRTTALSKLTQRIARAGAE